VFLELPDIGDAMIKGETFGTVESVKAVENLYSAVTGTVVERNDAVVDSPSRWQKTPTVRVVLKVRQ